jgi:hypothetical protein
VGIALAFGLLQVFVSNPIAKKLHPTKTDAGIVRKVGYSIVHHLVLVAIIVGIGAAIALFGH